MTSIAQRFQQLKEEGKLALMPFLMAGDPDLDTTRDVLLALQSAGADMVELGMPYSDPPADGPVIQAAASRALDSGTTPGKVLEMLGTLGDDFKLGDSVHLQQSLLNIGMEAFVTGSLRWSCGGGA